MLSLRIDDMEFFDERTETFITVKGQTIQLEHSLVSVSKWESKYHKPFLSKEKKTAEETLDYIKFMTVTQNVNPLLYTALTADQVKAINDYMDDPMTATVISKQEGKGSGVSRPVTSEEIYYSMTAYQIDWKAEKWHFNRLMMLLKVCEEKNKPKKKMRKGDIARRNHSLNAQRRARMGTRG